MRQGPIYPMHIYKTPRGRVTLNVPVELENDFTDCSSLNWRDDGNGVFTLILIKGEWNDKNSIP